MTCRADRGRGPGAGRRGHVRRAIGLGRRILGRRRITDGHGRRSCREQVRRRHKGRDTGGNRHETGGEAQTNQELRPLRWERSRDDAPADRFMPTRGLGELTLDRGWTRGPLDRTLRQSRIFWIAGKRAEVDEHSTSRETGPGIAVSRRLTWSEARGGQQSFVSPSEAVMSRVAGCCHGHGLTKKVGGARRIVSLHQPGC